MQVQAQHRHCGTDVMTQRAMDADPSIAINRAELERFTAEYTQSMANSRVAQGAPLFVIPIVFHIMHINGAENVTDEFIRGVVQRLNLDYSKRNADTSLVDPFFQSRIGDAKIEFRLAAKDPNGNCTSGINRIYTPFTIAANDNVKPLAAWPHNKYLNVYVVRDIAIDLTLPPGAYVAGYAYLPNTAPQAATGQLPGVNEGLVVRAGSLSTPTDNNRTLTHEIGHYLNLNHPFVGSVTEASNCNRTDNVDDTPPTKGTFGGGSCNPSLATSAQCPGQTISNYQNYMDYADCALMFTTGQVTRMRAALNNGGFSQRNNLWSAANRAATGTADTSSLSICAPKLRLDALSLGLCAGSASTLTAQIDNVDPTTPVNYTWYFNGAVQDTLVGRSVSPVYNTPGLYDLKVVATSSGGSDSLVKRGFVRVIPSETAYRTDTAAESFNSGFSLIDSLAGLRTWKTYTTTPAAKWTPTNSGYFGTKAMTIKTSDLGRGGRAILVSPVIDISTATTGINVNGMSLYFRYAANGSSNQDTTKMTDYLRVFASGDCGATFNEIASMSRRSTQRLYTTTSLLTTWRPSPANYNRDWKNFEMLVPRIYRTNRARFYFEVVSDNGGNIYVDDFGLGDVRPLAVSEELITNSKVLIAPNPATSQTQISFALTQAAHVEIQVLDLLGRNVAVKILGLQDTGEKTVMLNEVSNNLSAGVYLIQIKAGDKSFVPARVVVE
jgi:hypothetical protein